MESTVCPNPHVSGVQLPMATHQNSRTPKVVSMPNENEALERTKITPKAQEEHVTTVATVKMTREKIDPDKAMELLSKMPRNRHLSQGHVERLARMMTN